MCVICGLRRELKVKSVASRHRLRARQICSTAAADWPNGDAEPPNNPLRLLTVTVITVSVKIRIREYSPIFQMSKEKILQPLPPWAMQKFIILLNLALIYADNKSQEQWKY